MTPVEALKTLESDNQTPEGSLAHKSHSSNDIIGMNPLGVPRSPSYVGGNMLSSFFRREEHTPSPKHSPAKAAIPKRGSLKKPGWFDS